MVADVNRLLGASDDPWGRLLVDQQPTSTRRCQPQDLVGSDKQDLLIALTSGDD